MPASGSYREYIRLKSLHFTAIGTWNEDMKENNAFVSFSRHLRANGVTVPDIYEYDAQACIYLQEDLGDETLFAYLSGIRAEKGFSSEIIDATGK